MSHAQACASAPAKPRILIVEDEGLIAWDIETRVRKAGYDVAGVVDRGEEVAATVAECQPDLILMDIRLRGAMDGIEAAKQLKLRHDVPVVYLTAHSDRETLDRAKLTGPFAYLSKPIGHYNLPNCIETALFKHNAERELRQQRAWLRTTLNSMPDAVIVVDPSGQVQYLNPKAERLTSWSSKDAVNQPLSEVFKVRNTEGESPLEALVASCVFEGRSGALPAGLTLVTAPPEERLPIEGEIAPSGDETAGFGAVITFRDVTTKLQQEQVRRQEQKMQAVGRLAASVAHDFNNLLTVVLGHASLLMESGIASTAAAARSLGEIRAAAGTAAGITEQLLTFSRRQQSHPEFVNLSAVVAEQVDLCRSLLGPGVELKTSLTDTGNTYADPVHITQILVNLVINARDAMATGGVVTVSTENTELDQAVNGEHLKERFAVLSVADTGIGVEPSIADEIFEPFFTTKASGHGLGLSIVRNIVDELEGFIAVDSSPGLGSTFRIFIPANQKEFAA